MQYMLRCFFPFVENISDLQFQHLGPGILYLTSQILRIFFCIVKVSFEEIVICRFSVSSLLYFTSQDNRDEVMAWRR